MTPYGITRGVQVQTQEVYTWETLLRNELYLWIYKLIDGHNLGIIKLSLYFREAKSI